MRYFLQLLVTVLLFTSYSVNALPNGNYESALTLQLDSKHQFAHAGYYVAIDQGFYQEEGLSVNINAGQETDEPIKQLLYGSADYIIDGSSIVNHLNEHANLRVLATIEQFSPWVLLTKPNVTIKSLKDSVIALSHQANEIKIMLEKSGLIVSSYQTIDSDNISLFLQGTVDATVP